jgi:hypothetical protein
MIACLTVAPYVQPRRPRPPRNRLRNVRPYFYPGEVVRILNLEGVDYHQLRRLFRLVLSSRDLPLRATRRWARFTFQDLLAVKLALDLAGGAAALKPGHRLRLAALARTCETLRSKYGLEYPLREAKLERVGATLLAKIKAVEFEPATGQLVMREVADAVRAYMRSAPVAGGAKERAAVRLHLRKEQGTLGKGRSRGLVRKAGNAPIQVVNEIPRKKRSHV